LEEKKKLEKDIEKAEFFLIQSIKDMEVIFVFSII